LAEVFPQIQNAHMSVQDKGSDIQFLYTLKSGPANKSYGIQVAKLAGLPAAVVDRARDLLKTHERAARTEVDLFSFAAAPEVDPKVLQLLEQIKNIKTLEVTPLQALNQIAQWQQELS
jgi:DNA mismatch repair protein MutS